MESMQQEPPKPPQQQKGKLVATRGQWAEYIHPSGTYWVHVLTKERTTERPGDFEVKASRDASGKLRTHGENDPCCLYIQNIPTNWGRPELIEHFQHFGILFWLTLVVIKF